MKAYAEVFAGCSMSSTLLLSLCFCGSFSSETRYIGIVYAIMLIYISLLLSFETILLGEYTFKLFYSLD